MSCGALSIACPSAGLVYNRLFEDLVRQHGLLDFDRVMGLKAAQVVKAAVPERSTVRVCLQQQTGTVAVYLKRHHPAGFARHLLEMLRLSRQRTARDEFRNIVAFHQAGLPTMLPIAAGRRRRRFFLRESFLITQELAGCRRLDHYLAAGAAVPADQKRRLVTQLALLVQRMHARGFNHRDLYLCHILVNERGQLFIVDLHRVDQRSSVPERWKVKDLAALSYSAPAAIASRTDRLRFLKQYLGVQQLSAADKVFAGKILKKTQKMVQHNQRRVPRPCS